jgi:hypothetical protein
VPEPVEGVRQVERHVRPLPQNLRHGRGQVEGQPAARPVSSREHVKYGAIGGTELADQRRRRRDWRQDGWAL